MFTTWTTVVALETRIDADDVNGFEWTGSLAFAAAEFVALVWVDVCHDLVVVDKGTSSLLEKLRGDVRGYEAENQEKSVELHVWGCQL
jgi:hypothetical protein